VLAGTIRAFMPILNIQITNAALLDIEGGIGTDVDSGAWISTSVLIGEIVGIPLTDYLSGVFSFRRHDHKRDPVSARLDHLRFHARSGLDDRRARPPGLCWRHPDPHGLHYGVDQAADAPAAKRGKLWKTPQATGELQVMPLSNATNRSTFRGLTAS
jgi:hypothetical protein